MDIHLASLLKKDIIESSNSGYAATSRIIRKKNGSGRLVVNYIPLNAVTIRDSYALPHISDIIGVLQGKQYFSTLDCTQGFYQIQVDERDRHKTAFSTPFGNYQFKRCPFGARNSCAKFQSEMNRIFREGLYKKCVIYVDDILVFGKTRQEHDDNLAWVLARAKENNVKIKLEKCNFATNEVYYLGFTINGNNIKPLEDKVETLIKSKPPRNRTELRSILGKLNFYSRFIPNYSKLLEPFRSLLSKNRDFQWKSSHQKAFENIISMLNNASSHTLAPRSKDNIIHIQVLDDSIETSCLTNDSKLISRASRLLLQSETNYSETEKQLLALSFAIDKFKLWLDKECIKVKTSCKQLEKAVNLIHRPPRVERLLLNIPEGFDTFVFEGEEKNNLAYNPKKHIPQEIYYIDGACKRNGKPDCRSSWAVCAEFDRELETCGYVKEMPSNQSAELNAAIEACKLARLRRQDEITIVTDSKYLHSAVTEWIDKWKANEWKDHKNKPLIHVELFKQLLNAKENIQINWIHVKSHSNNEGNNRADAIARRLLEKHEEVVVFSNRSESSRR